MNAIQLMYPTKSLKSKRACYRHMRGILQAMSRTFEEEVLKHKNYDLWDDCLLAYTQVLQECVQKIKDFELQEAKKEDHS